MYSCCLAGSIHTVGNNAQNGETKKERKRKEKERKVEREKKNAK